MCALEAMALGTPVVSTPTDGMKDLIQSGENGFLSDDDRDLAAAVERILSDSAYREKLSREEQETFRRINDPQAYKAAIAACYGEKI